VSCPEESKRESKYLPFVWADAEEGRDLLN